MKKSDHAPTGKTWSTLDKLRGVEFHGPEEFAEFLEKENVEFSARDLASFGHILVTRFGRKGGTIHVPEWLAEVFTSLVDGFSAKTICDPWAGVGLLIGILRETLNAKTAIALTPNRGELALGKVMVPQADWQCGEPMRILAEQKDEMNVVASILPMGMRSQQPLHVSLASGETAEVAGDLGDQLLVASSVRLSPSGVGLFVVPSSFFFSQQSVFSRLGVFGIGIEAAFSLPPGTFAPLTSISTYLVVVRRNLHPKMFAAQLSSDANTNAQIFDNFRAGREGGSLELGRFVAINGFQGIEQLRGADALSKAEARFGSPAVELAELSDVKSSVNLGRPDDGFRFEPLENAIYVPLIGNSDVVESPNDFQLKPQNYAQVVIDPSRSNASFVARFLNSDFGKELREQAKTGFIPKLNKQTLKRLRVFVPDLVTQRKMLSVEAKITAEHTTVMALQNEVAELRRGLWATPKAVPEVEQRIGELARRLAGGVQQHALATLDQWFETLPFPLASILRAWQATPSHDFKTRYEHLLHFFEGTAEFVSVILLSAFSSNEAVFAIHRQKLNEVLQKQNLSFNRATFGTWKLVVEYLGKQTRNLLNETGKSPKDAKNERMLCGDMFGDPSLSLPEALSRKELAAILSTTNMMRNDWSGHGGVVGQEEAKSRNQQLLAEVEKLRKAIADTWAETQLMHALHCRPRQGIFENEVAVLMGSNTEFLKEAREMSTWLDVERLYLSKRDSGRALKLLPLIQVGPSPPSEKNACYFFSRLEREGARFVSYHFSDQPELKGQFTDAADAIKLLMES